MLQLCTDQRVERGAARNGGESCEEHAQILSLLRDNSLRNPWALEDGVSGSTFCSCAGSRFPGVLALSTVGYMPHVQRMIADTISPSVQTPMQSARVLRVLLHCFLSKGWATESELVSHPGATRRGAFLCPKESQLRQQGAEGQRSPDAVTRNAYPMKEAVCLQPDPIRACDLVQNECPNTISSFCCCRPGSGLAPVLNLVDESHTGVRLTEPKRCSMWSSCTDPTPYTYSMVRTLLDTSALYMHSPAVWICAILAMRKRCSTGPGRSGVPCLQWERHTRT